MNFMNCKHHTKMSTMGFTLLDTRKLRSNVEKYKTKDVGGDCLPSKSIQRIEQYRDLITQRLIKGTITRMRRFDMNGKVKPKKLKLAEFAILDESERGFYPLRTLVPTPPALSLGPFESERLYQFGGFSSDSE